MKAAISFAILASLFVSTLALNESDITPDLPSQPPSNAALRRRAPKNKSSSGNKNSNISAAGPFTGKLTWYDVGGDACGTHSKASDMVAALNKPQYGNTDEVSPNCGRCAKIKGDKATIVVKIVDACPECKFGSLDLSKAAFNKVTKADGVAKDISWSWVKC
ncbi:hypothetical protein IWW37_004399 [Coemansia sp. RSA 2050]|nr:hypothetical protein IWW37_004399 [Coemansia sp. RSA 2050]KAJ2731505.1 hypothetical protein IW152_004478 [Coemansia sp. BCRC 34962]